MGQNETMRHFGNINDAIFSMQTTNMVSPQYIWLRAMRRTHHTYIIDKK